MRFLGYDIKNQKILEDFEAGIVSAIGSMFVYSIVISLIFVWYRYSSPGKKKVRDRSGTSGGDGDGSKPYVSG